MQINSNPQIPQQKNASFGMALKITKPAMEVLENSSMETINKLAKIGDDLTDTKYYHLVIGKDLKYWIEDCSNPYNKQAYYPNYLLCKKPRGTRTYLSVTAMKYDVLHTYFYRESPRRFGIIGFDNREEMLKAYDTLKNTINKIEGAVELTKMLDKYECKRHEQLAAEAAAKRAAEAEKKAKIKEAASKLLEKFGVEEVVK